MTEDEATVKRLWKLVEELQGEYKRAELDTERQTLKYALDLMSRELLKAKSRVAVAKRRIALPKSPLRKTKTMITTTLPSGRVITLEEWV